MKPRAKRSDNDLQAIAKHIVYEFQMLQQTCELARAEEDVLRRNAFLESFTIHARNLLDFFYSPQGPKKFPKPDDVIAEDFFDDPTLWHTKRPGKSDILSTVHLRVGKEIAHLTYHRLSVTKTGKQWPNSRIANEIRTVFMRFKELAPPDRLSPVVAKFFDNTLTTRNLFSSSSSTTSEALEE